MSRDATGLTPGAGGLQAGPMQGMLRDRPAVAVLLGATMLANFASTALTNVLALVACLVAVFYWGAYRPWYLLRHPLAWLCAGFMGWLLTRELLSGSSLREAGAQFSDFRVLLFIALWAPLMAAPLHRRAVWWALGAGLLAYSVAALGVLWVHGRPIIGSYYNGAADASGPALAFGIAAAGYMAFRAAQLKDRTRVLMWTALLALGLAAMLFGSIRRTGYVSLFGCLLVLAFAYAHSAHARLRKALVLGALLAIPVLAFVSSPVVQVRIGELVNEQSDFFATPEAQRGEIKTSTGYRLRFWNVTLHVIGQSPLTGVGLTRLPAAYTEQVRQLGMGGAALNPDEGANPHNEFLLVAGGLGLVGLALYLAILQQLWRAGTHKRPEGHAMVARLALASWGLSLLFNSMVIDQKPSHFFLLSMLCVAWFSSQQGHRADADA